MAYAFLLERCLATLQKLELLKFLNGTRMANLGTFLVVNHCLKSNYSASISGDGHIITVVDREQSTIGGVNIHRWTSDKEQASWMLLGHTCDCEQRPRASV